MSKYAGARAALRTISNPPNPWESTSVDWLGEPPKAKLSIFEDHTRSILSKNESPDLGFKYSVNPYRGCYHACAYCYARRSHQFLGFGAGTDFERKLILKAHAAKLLRKAFERRAWAGDLVLFSGNTDCYQPLEATHGLTRACLKVCLDFRNPVGIITKGTLIERDIDLLRDLHKNAFCQVMISIPFSQTDNARVVEPHVASPSRRFETIRRLAGEGIEVGVMVAPIIPGLNDQDIPEILEKARAAGARFCNKTLLRLSGEVEDVFVERLTKALPLRAKRVLHQIEACRQGSRSDARFGHRMSGTGPRWHIIENLFRKATQRLGYERARPVPDPSPFVRAPSKNSTMLLPGFEHSAGHRG